MYKGGGWGFETFGIVENLAEVDQNCPCLSGAALTLISAWGGNNGPNEIILVRYRIVTEQPERPSPRRHNGTWTEDRNAWIRPPPEFRSAGTPATRSGDQRVAP